jgi:DNA-binding NtrC family response regulator
MTMPEQRDCRVLIVDNRPEEAARVAAGLVEIRPSLINNNRLKIQLTNTAYFVAEQLRDCPPGNPPWDIIISDVFMPIPSDPFKKEAGVVTASETTYQYEGRKWPYWEYQYSWNSQKSEIGHGGFYIAHTIKALKESDKSLANLKLVLISSRLFGEDRELLEGFTASDRNWLEYHDKSAYEGTAAMEGWPKHNLRQDIFKWALIQAISKRESEFWGDAIVEIIPHAEDYLIASQSPSMQEAVVEGRRLGSSRGVHAVLITGEIETGKEVMANIVSLDRGDALGRRLAFVKIDCSTIPPEQFESELFGSWDERRQETSRRGLVDASSGGTLYFKDLDQLPPYHQGKLVTLLKDGIFRREKGTESIRSGTELIICSMTKDPAELVEGNLFHPDVYLFIKANRIHVPPLRERPGDIVPLAERAISRSGEDIQLTPDAESWLRSQSWPGNVRDLMSTVASVAHQSTSSTLTAEAFQSIGTISQSKTIPPVIEEDSFKAFKAVPPFQLHWGEPMLLDAQGHQLPLLADLHNVLKELLRKEPGSRKDMKTTLNYEETASAYKGRGSFSTVEEAREIAQAFVRNLRRNLKKHDVEPDSLVVSRKGFGYLLGNGWANPPVIYHSEPSIFQLKNGEPSEPEY